MSVVRSIDIRITGQVPDGYGYGNNKYEIVIAKLKLICAEYHLDLEEIDYERDNNK